MNATDFRRLAQLRIQESEVLFQKSLYLGAYYLCGYAVECGLKACIAKRTKRGDFPPSVNEVRNVYVHDLDKLLDLVGNPLKLAIKGSPVRSSRWDVVKDWNEQSRYEFRPKKEAKLLAYAMLQAVTEAQNGIFPCIRQHW